MLNRNSQNIINVLEKLSKFVQEYAEENHVAKYLERRTFKDKNELIFYGMLINKDKLFSHTSYFKNYKTTLEMINSQGKTPVFYSSRESWMNDKHSIYLKIELLMYKIFTLLPGGDSDVTENDLSFINELYKKFKHDIKKKANK